MLLDKLQEIKDQKDAEINVLKLQIQAQKIQHDYLSQLNKTTADSDLKEKMQNREIALKLKTGEGI